MREVNLFLSSNRFGGIYFLMSLGSAITYFYPSESWYIIPSIAVVIGFQKVVGEG